MTVALEMNLARTAVFRRIRLGIILVACVLALGCSGRSATGDAAATNDAGVTGVDDDAGMANTGSGGRTGTGGGAGGGGALGAGGIAGAADTGMADSGASGVGGVGGGAAGAPGTGPVIAIAAGGSDSCAIRRDHTAFCWGDNSLGQLGNKTAGFPDVAAIAPAGDHTCALATEGAVSCWGSNANGGIGDGTVFPRAPTLVNGLALPATAIAAGRNSTCAVLSNSTVMCWGAAAGDGTGVLRLSPVPLVGLPPVLGISAGTDTCALLSDGTVQCWGLAPTLVPGLSNVAAIAGQCALLADGTVMCWGANTSGQLGDGTMTSSLTPVRNVLVSGVAAIATGTSFACALLAADGTIHCWGINSFGQLGNGRASTPSLTGVLVTPGPSGFPAPAVAIAAGTSHALALLADGTVWGWGSNANHQIGPAQNLSSAPRPIPIQ